MESPAKRPRLAGDNGSADSQLPGTSRSRHNSGQQSNTFEGYGLQNTGHFEARRDFVIHIDKPSNASVEVDQRRGLLESLQFEQMDAREWSIKKELARTCEWFLKTPKYIDWTHENALHDDHNFLWIKGKPGAGKSTLMKFLLERLRDRTRQAGSKEVLLSFFFNARGHDLEKTTVGLHRSLLLQLLEARTDLRYVLDKVRIGHRWTIESLKFVFGEAVRGLGGDSLICLVDALDECEEAQIRDMVSFLSGPDIIRNGVRICFASRHYPHVSVKTAIEIVLESQSGHDKDIESYLNSALIIEDGPLAKQIRCNLQKKASGIFMWVVLVVDILNREYDAGRQHSLLSLIQQLPDDLHELFRRILTRDNNNLDGLLLCIQWVLFAEPPLTPKQLYFAILSGLEPDVLESCHSDTISEDNIKKYILNNSKGLAESTKSKMSTVQFIHESVRDFLLKEDGFSEIKPNLLANVSGQSHNTLLKCCLAYTNMKALTEIKAPSHEVITRDFPFLQYANQGILYHAEQAESHNVSQRDFLDIFPLSQWVKHHNIVENNKLHGYTSKVSLLYILAEAGMHALIRAHPTRQSCFEVENEQYGPPILAAKATGSSAAVEAMLDLEAEPLVESWPPNLRTLISSSLRIRRLSTSPFIFNRTIDVMHELMEHGKERISLYFLATRRCDMNARGPKGETILISAMERKYDVLVKALLEMGADKEAANAVGQRPLFIAVSQKDLEMAELLLKAGANPDATDAGGQSSLWIASCSGYTKAAELLINYGASSQACVYGDKTALYVASRNGFSRIVELLVKSGADVSAVNKDGQTPLYAASASGIVKIVEILLSSGADISTANCFGVTPLLQALNHRSSEIAETLINHGANVSAADKKGITPLHEASVAGFYKIAEMLISRGANVSAADRKGITPLHGALVARSYKIAEMLINRGANVSAADKKGITPLHEASVAGSYKISEMLINRGADVSATENYGQTPLFMASRRGNINVVRLLIKHGANVLTRDIHGRTPLFVAEAFGHAHVAKILINQGA
ncbi:hypothetical protein ANO14919_022460 [Xylariales sp. No.14919]|nr:hypothetical protein ANO14919_022460 [Xylariales sp. No.14919]